MPSLPNLLRVDWTEWAIDDLDSIAQWIARGSPMRAHQVFDRLEVAVASLEVNPARGRVVPELAFIGEWREIVFRPWRIVYQVGEQSVVVVAIIDGRRSVREELVRRSLSLGPGGQ